MFVPVRSCLFRTVPHCHHLQIALMCDPLPECCVRGSHAVAVCSRPQGALGTHCAPHQDMTIRVMGSQREGCPQPREGQAGKGEPARQGTGGTTRGSWGDACSAILPPTSHRPPARGCSPGWVAWWLRAQAPSNTDLGLNPGHDTGSSLTLGWLVFALN